MSKKLLAVLLVLCLCLAACAKAPVEDFAEVTPTPTAAPTETPAPKLDKELVILYTNDIHCAVDSNLGYTGVAAARAAIAESGRYTALVDCGDAIQGAPIGTLSTGSYLIDIMNEMGYDVATPGNHEFDYGMERFLALKDMAKFPYLSCNFVDLATGNPVLDSYKIMTFGQLKVAFVGISTPQTITSSTPAYFQDDSGNFIYGFCQGNEGADLYAAVQTAVDAARAEGADYVVAVAHLGIDASSSPWTSSEVIENTTGIDAVLDGHSHSVVPCEMVKNKDGQSVILTQTGTKLNNIGMLTIRPDGSMSAQLVAYASDVSKFIEDIQAQYEETLAQVVAHSDYDLLIYDPVKTDVRIVRNAETNLGDLCADAYRAATGADIAFVNGGGVRVNIKAGDITYGDILNVNPFGNAVCMVEATGQEILDALEFGARAVPAESGGFLQVSGLTYEIHTYIESSVKTTEEKMFVSVDGEYRVKNVMVGEEALDLTKTYTLACHDYLLLNAGDGYTMFQDNTLLLDRVMLDNQALISYITNQLGGVIPETYAAPYGQERIVAVEVKPA